MRVAPPLSPIGLDQCAVSAEIPAHVTLAPFDNPPVPAQKIAAEARGETVPAGGSMSYAVELVGDGAHKPGWTSSEKGDLKGIHQSPTPRQPSASRRHEVVKTWGPHHRTRGCATTMPRRQRITIMNTKSTSPNNTIPRTPSAAGMTSGSRRATSTPTRRGRAALLDRHPAAERDRGPAPGSRPEQHAPGHLDPLAADAGLRRPLDAGHRPRRHRHPGGRREAAARGREEDPPRPRPRGAGRADLGLERRVRETHPQPAPADGLLVRLGAHPLHARPDLCTGGPRTFFRPLPGRPDLSRQAAGQLGHPSPHGRRRRRDLLRRPSRAISGRSSTRSPAQPAARPCTSPRPGPRRCSATPPWPSIPTTRGSST